MLIELHIDDRTPLAGRLVVENAEPVEFRGWLELLRLVSDLLEADGPGTEGDRGRKEAFR